MLEGLGAELEETHHGRVKVHLNGEEETFARPHQKQMSDKNEVMELRHFLERAGVTPSAP